MAFWTMFAMLWTVGAVVGLGHEYWQVRHALATGEYLRVEGVVTNYQPAPAEGHQDESFDVNDQHYSFSDYVNVQGYHKSQSHGGIFRPGLHVRISDVGGVIARLEVATTDSSRGAP